MGLQRVIVIRPQMCYHKPKHLNSIFYHCGKSTMSHILGITELQCFYFNRQSREGVSGFKEDGFPPAPQGMSPKKGGNG